MVQRRAARLTLNRYRNRSRVSTMIEELRWTSLEERREHQRGMMLYKIQNGLVVADGSQYLTLVNQPTRHNHTHAFIVPQSSSDHHRVPFSQGQSDNGSLFQTQVTAPSLDTFTRRLVTEKE